MKEIILKRKNKVLEIALYGGPRTYRPTDVWFTLKAENPFTNSIKPVFFFQNDQHFENKDDVEKYIVAMTKKVFKTVRETEFEQIKNTVIAFYTKD